MFGGYAKIILLNVNIFV